MKKRIRSIAACAAAAGIVLAALSAGWGAAAEAKAASAPVAGAKYGPDARKETAAAFPFGIAEAADGGLMIADQYHKAIWLEKEGKTLRYAGASGPEGLYGEPAGGYADGRLSSMEMKSPWDIIPYRDGYAVSDSENHVVRYLTPEGAKTLAGAGQEGFLDQMANHALFSMPSGLAADPEGNLYIADTGNDAIRVMTPNGQVSTCARGLSGPTGLVYYGGALYAADTGNHRIVKIQDGEVTVLAGNGTAGYLNGSYSEASFQTPVQLAAAPDGTLYVSDTGNGVVRKLDPGTDGGVVTTLGGQDSSMVSPAGLLVKDESLYICDSFMRKIYILPR